MKRSLALVSIPLLLAVVGWAGHGNGQSELEMIRSEANNGDAGAELLYGLALLEGRYGLRPNQGEAMQWIQRAAEGGDPFAALKLGNAYADGTGMPEDPARAAQWWDKAGREGNAEAKYRLGKAYLEGKGVPQDADKAAQWLEQAAAEGNTHAQYELGRMYHEGYAVVQDQELAKDWLSRAAAQGYGEATNLLGVVNSFIKSITPIAGESYEALHERAEQDDPHAQYELGLRYRDGVAEVNRDQAKAVKWLAMAAGNGNLLAMRSLADVYARGGWVLRGTPPSPPTGVSAPGARPVWGSQRVRKRIDRNTRGRSRSIPPKPLLACLETTPTPGR